MTDLPTTDDIIFERGMTEIKSKDYVAARETFTFLAKKKHGGATYNLGVMCELGHGHEPDKIGAYKWFSLAKNLLFEDAQKRMDALKAEMTDAEISKAEDLMDKWLSYGFHQDDDS